MTKDDFAPGKRRRNEEKMEVDYERENNNVHVEGTLIEPFAYSHCFFGEKFYASTIAVQRLSGVEDHIRIMVSEVLIDIDKINAAKSPVLLKIDGSYRSFNYADENGKDHLSLFVFAKSVTANQDDPEGITDDDECKNVIHLTGVICKEPFYKEKRSGRKITGLFLAVNRTHNKCDYIPVITWNRAAIRAKDLKIGDRITLSGRIQSRRYGQDKEFEAFEVSADGFDKIEKTELKSATEDAAKEEAANV